MKVGDRVFVDMGRLVEGRPYTSPGPNAPNVNRFFRDGEPVEAIIKEIRADSATLELRAEGMKGQVIDVPLDLITEEV